MWTVILLTVSNVFMTFAWYGHLKYPRIELWKVVLVSWAIAFLEYCLMVPANRVGQEVYKYSGAQLKTIQEVITLTVFVVFSVFYLKQGIRWNHLAGFALMALAAFLVFSSPTTPGVPAAEASDGRH